MSNQTVDVRDMCGLNAWSATALERYRRYLRTRAELLGLDPRLRVRADESDIVQETLRRAAASTKPCQGPGEEEDWLPWLRKIEDNVFIDLLREHHAELRDVDREQAQRMLDESSAAWEKRLADSGLSASAIVARQEQFVRVAAAVQELPAAQREALLGVFFLGQSLQEVALLHGKTKGQVAGAYARGLVALRQRLQDLEEDQP